MVPILVRCHSPENRVRKEGSEMVWVPIFGFRPLACRAVGVGVRLLRERLVGAGAASVLACGAHPGDAPAVSVAEYAENVRRICGECAENMRRICRQERDPHGVREVEGGGVAGRGKGEGGRGKGSGGWNDDVSRPSRRLITASAHLTPTAASRPEIAYATDRVRVRGALLCVAVRCCALLCVAVRRCAFHTPSTYRSAMAGVTGRS